MSDTLKLTMEAIQRARDESGDQLRASGRTNRMLLKAIIAASEGEKVLVTAEGDRYVQSLMLKSMEIIEVTFTEHSYGITNHQINMIGGGVIWFVDHNGKGISRPHWSQIVKQATVSISDHYRKRRL